MKNTYVQVTKNFNTWEARCRGINCCGASAPMHPDLWPKLEELRTQVEAPLILTSGFRCLTHNRALKSSKDTSQHCLGTAVDVWIPNGINHSVFFEYCKILFRGTGLYKGFVHLDLRTGRKATWYGSY